MHIKPRRYVVLNQTVINPGRLDQKAFSLILSRLSYHTAPSGYAPGTTVYVHTVLYDLGPSATAADEGSFERHITALILESPPQLGYVSETYKQDTSAAAKRIPNEIHTL